MGMHARVIGVELGDLDRARTFVRDQVVPSARQQSGLVAGYWLLDRANGHGLAVTIWESEEAMLASETVAQETARREQQDGGVEAATTQRYEVIARL